MMLFVGLMMLGTVLAFAFVMLWESGQVCDHPVYCVEARVTPRAVVAEELLPTPIVIVVVQPAARSTARPVMRQSVPAQYHPPHQ